MARPPKPSVRFYLPNKTAKQEEDREIKLRGVASYNRRRLTFYIVLNPADVACIFAGIVNPNAPEPINFIIRQDLKINQEDAENFAMHILMIREFMLTLIEKVVKADAWGLMTSEDLKFFLQHYMTLQKANKKGKYVVSKTLTRELINGIVSRRGLLGEWLKAKRLDFGV